VFKNPKILSHLGLLPLSCLNFGHELKTKVIALSLSTFHLFSSLFIFLGVEFDCKLNVCYKVLLSQWSSCLHCILSKNVQFTFFLIHPFLFPFIFCVSIHPFFIFSCLVQNAKLCYRLTDLCKILSNYSDHFVILIIF
jgi:hypothetical protein